MKARGLSMGEKQAIWNLRKCPEKERNHWRPEQSKQKWSAKENNNSS